MDIVAATNLDDTEQLVHSASSANQETAPKTLSRRRKAKWKPLSSKHIARDLAAKGKTLGGSVGGIRGARPYDAFCRNGRNHWALAGNSADLIAK
jgi:hypothetical protein